MVIKNKRAQFYLILAIIIVVVILGIASVTNYVITKRDDSKEHLSKELQLESESVINYGIVNGADLSFELSNFAEKYGNYVGDKGYEFLFIYGDAITIAGGHVNVWSSLESEPGSVGIDFGRSRSALPISTRIIEEGVFEVDSSGETVTVNIGNVNEVFTLTEGQNLFFMVQQPRESHIDETI